MFFDDFFVTNQNFCNFALLKITLKMDKIRLNEILKMDDSIVSMLDLVVMERLSMKYPYCSIFKVLGVKFAYIVNSFNKTEWTAIASVYIQDREYLNKILSDIKTSKSTNKKLIIEKENEDIIKKINSYQDKQLSDNPTKQELLDKFLEIEQPITARPIRQEIAKDKDLERVITDSAKKDFKIVTESMAKIYAKQGDKSTAIEIYKRLIKKYPNKVQYYTNQIEILKNN